jgi:hypothetical protein
MKVGLILMDFTQDDVEPNGDRIILFTTIDKI